MKNKIQFLLLYAIINTSIMCLAKDTINFFFKPYPPDIQSLSQEKIESLVRTPGKLSRYLFKQYLNDTSITGICCSYMGYFSVSSYNGQVQFPRKQTHSRFTLIITPIVQPIIMLSNTVHHLELVPNKPTHLYAVSYQEDAQTQIRYWKVEKMESVDKNIVPLHAIIIFADPQSIYVPEGVTPVAKQLQIVLPDMYVKKPSHRIRILSLLLNIKQFFKNVPVITHDVSKTVSDTVVEY